MSLRDQLQQTLGSAYTIERELGGGGMSHVFVATEHALARRVVIKVLPPNLGIELSAERFAREIMLAAGLQHPCIVPVLTAGVADGVPFYTMPFVDGPSLRARLDERRRLPVDEAVGVLRDVASALAYAHARGIVHRDIKPENVLLSGGYAQVTDFGIARAISQSRSPAAAGHGRLTQSGLAIGTPPYMAPEQAIGDEAMDHRVDLYAIGCVAYELLTGAPPFTGKPPHMILQAQIHEAPEDIRARRADLPPDIAALVMRCLEKDPARRPQSADELLQHFRANRAPAVPAARAHALRVPHVPHVPMWAWYLTLATAVAAVGVGLFTALRHRADSSAAASIAVLPFTNVTGDTGQDYIARGLADDLTSALAEIPGLRVASRSAAFALDAKTIDPRSVGRALDVDNLLEGSVNQAGGRLRVNAMLVRTSDGIATWTKQIDRPAGDLFAAQDDIARTIARSLRLKLHNGPDSLGRPHTPPAAAHESYLRGEALLDRGATDAVEAALAEFARAVAIDSGYAQPYVGLAAAYTLLAGQGVAQDEAYTKAKAAAQRALQLDPASRDARAVMARLPR